jgi:dUTP pyrophosphatase
MKVLKVKIKRLPHAEGLQLPFYATPGAAGMDLLYAGYEEVVLKPFCLRATKPRCVQEAGLL